MIEELDNKTTQEFNIQYYLGIVRRRHLHFLIALFAGWVVVWGLSWVLPPKYQSSTLILVEQPTMPKDYVTPNVNDDLQERLQSITQQILSRTRLLHIIDQFGLYASDHTQRTPDEKVELMRKDIKIDLVRNGRNQISSFNICFTSRNPRLAQQVTSELSNLFISENLQARQHQSEDTTNFLEAQLEAARASLSEQEDKVRAFKGQHAGEMPGQLASNLQILSGLQSQLRTEEDALNAAKQQHVYLQTMVDQYRALQGQGKGKGGVLVGGELSALDQELDRLTAQLADLKARYTDQHPDVRKVKEQIAETEKNREQLLAEMKASSAQPASSDASSLSVQNADPSQAPMLAQVQSQLKSNQIELSNREHAVADLKDRIEAYQVRLNQEPIREQQLADLTRGYDQSKANYDELLKKKNESAMATKMELLQQGERFRIMDPPSLPQKPEFPNRLTFCALGVGLGVLLGAAVAGAFELLDKRLHTVEEIRDLVPAEVICEIPAILNSSDAQIEKRKLWLAWTTAAVVLGSILAGSAASYLRG
jgi:succinoglycan biosynthesis transport protein ExoP